MNIAFGFLSESGKVIDELQKLPAEKQLSDPDYWSTVGIISLTGILVVFLILAILIFFFWIIGTIFKVIDKSKAAKKAAKQVETAPAPVAEAEKSEVAEEIDDNEEIVAVISAAIAAYAESEGKSLTVTGIKKRSVGRSRSAWSMAGINGNIGRF